MWIGLIYTVRILSTSTLIVSTLCPTSLSTHEESMSNPQKHEKLTHRRILNSEYVRFSNLRKAQVHQVLRNQKICICNVTNNKHSNLLCRILNMQHLHHHL